MPSTTFSSGTTIPSTWLNEVNGTVWSLFGAATTPAAGRTALGLGPLSVPITSLTTTEGYTPVLTSSSVNSISTLTPGNTFNTGISVSFGSGIMTITLKGAGNVDLSSTNPAYFMGPNGVIYKLVNNLSIAVPAAAGLGWGITGPTCRVWVFLARTVNGTIHLGVTQSYDATDKNLRVFNPFPGSGVAPTTISATFGSAGVLYVTDNSAASLLDFAVCVGYINAADNGGGASWTAGTAVNTNRFFSGTLARITTVGASFITATTTIPNDNTVPQNTEGTLAYNVTSLPSLTVTTLQGTPIAAVSAAARIITAAFSTNFPTNSFWVTSTHAATINAAFAIPIQTPLDLGPTITVRMGPSAAGTLTLGGESGGVLFGGGGVAANISAYSYYL